jgi:hypothetical protein
MWEMRRILFFLTASVLLVPSAKAVESSDVEMWECPLADGTMLYTNKERPGCQSKPLKPLSTVPSLSEMPMLPPGSAMQFQPPVRPDWYSFDTPIGALRNMRQIPDWSRDWYANNAQGGPVLMEVCSMYMEWLNLNQKTRGGIFYGTDPSYGGDPLARNWRLPSMSFYDNTRYQALSRMFGAGFIPIGCQ